MKILSLVGRREEEEGTGRDRKERKGSNILAHGKKLNKLIV